MMNSGCRLVDLQLPLGTVSPCPPLLCIVVLSSVCSPFGLHVILLCVATFSSLSSVASNRARLSAAGPQHRDSPSPPSGHRRDDRWMSVGHRGAEPGLAYQPRPPSSHGLRVAVGRHLIRDFTSVTPIHTHPVLLLRISDVNCAAEVRHLMGGDICTIWSRNVALRH
jgi:hypothetical protein